MKTNTMKAEGNKVAEATENNTNSVIIKSIATAKKEAEAKAEKATEAKAEAKEKAKALKEATKKAEKATKEAEKAEAKAKDCKPSEATEAKAKAKEAKAEAKKAEQAKAKAEKAKAEAEAKESKAVAEATEAKEAEKVATEREKAGAKTLTIKAEAERKGLNSAVRSLLESVKDCTDTEALAFLSFVGKVATSEAKAKAEALKVTKEEVLTSYRTFSSFAVVDGEGRKKVAKAVRYEAEANAYTFEPSNLFNIKAIFESPASNRRSNKKQFLAVAGTYYEKVKGGYNPITKAEAEARAKEAKIKAEAEASRRAEAERQAEADRKRGEAVRKAEEKAKKASK